MQSRFEIERVRRTGSLKGQSISFAFIDWPFVEIIFASDQFRPGDPHHIPIPRRRTIEGLIDIVLGQEGWERSRRLRDGVKKGDYSYQLSHTCL